MITCEDCIWVKTHIVLVNKKDEFWKKKYTCEIFGKIHNPEVTCDMHEVYKE